MTLPMKALLGLFCLLALAACGPLPGEATPTPTETATLEPTATLAPTETPAPTNTPAPAVPTDAATGGTQPEGAVTQPAGQPTTAAGAQPPAANPGGAAPDKYTYLGQDVADGTQFLPNRTVTVTWTVQNSGTTGWTKEYTLRHFAGPEPAKTVYPFTKDVPVNDTINFIVTFTTPTEPGDYDLWFKLTNSAGQNFGDVNLMFTVSNNPVRATPTAAQ